MRSLFCLEVGGSSTPAGKVRIPAHLLPDGWICNGADSLILIASVLLSSRTLSTLVFLIHPKGMKEIHTKLSQGPELRMMFERRGIYVFLHFSSKLKELNFYISLEKWV